MWNRSETRFHNVELSSRNPTTFQRVTPPVGRVLGADAPIAAADLSLPRRLARNIVVFVLPMGHVALDQASPSLTGPSYSPPINLVTVETALALSE